jgi:hypothetical protein
MRAMYHDKRLNISILGLSALALIVFFALIRQRFAISDVQFLKSMVPHHSGAILMCRKAPSASGSSRSGRRPCGDCPRGQTRGTAGPRESRPPGATPGGAHHHLRWGGGVPHEAVPHGVRRDARAEKSDPSRAFAVTYGTLANRLLMAPVMAPALL